MHTSLDDKDSRDDGGGYYYCSKCGNQKKRHRRGEFHEIKGKVKPSRKHACLEEYLMDNTHEFWSCLVTVGVNIAWRMAAKMYLREEEKIDQAYVDQWLPEGTFFGEAIPHVVEYQAANSKVPSQEFYGIDGLLEYLGIPELDMTPAPEIVLRPNRGRGRGSAVAQTPNVSPGGAQGQDRQLERGAVKPAGQGKGANETLQLGKNQSPGKTRAGVQHTAGSPELIKRTQGRDPPVEQIGVPTEGPGVGATSQEEGVGKQWPDKTGISDSDTKLSTEVVGKDGVPQQESCASRHLRLSKVRRVRQSYRLIEQRQKGGVESPKKGVL